MPYEYVSQTDGRRKATLADAFVRERESDAPGLASSELKQPWATGWQVSERNLMWSDDLKAKLIARVTAEQLGCTEEELERRVADLVAVLPGLRIRMQTMKPAVLSQLARDPAGVAERLLALKAVFPTANIEQMVLRDLPLLERSVEDVSQAAAGLRELLPADVDVDRLCEEHPSMLDVPSFKEALGEVRRLMPKLDISRALTTQPEIIFSVQRRSNMIEYEPVPGSSHEHA